MNSCCDVCVLCLNINNDNTLVGIESNLITRKASIFANIPNHLFEVNFALVDADLAQEYDHTSLCRCLHGNFCIWVDSQACIEYTIGDLVA